MDLYRILIEFVIIYIVLYLLYYFFVIKRSKKDKKKIPSEVGIILTIYRIDYNKISLSKLCMVVGIITPLILAISITIISELFESVVLALLIGTLVSLILAFALYGFVGQYFKKQENKMIEKK